MTNTLSKEELLDSLDFEILQINSERAVRGWIPWIIASAFGALVWTLLGELKDNSSAQSDLGLILVWATLVISTITAFFTFLFSGREGAKPRELRFFASRKLLGSSRQSLAILFAAETTLLWFVFDARDRLPFAIFLGCLFVFSFSCLGSVLAIALSYSDYLLPVFSVGQRNALKYVNSIRIVILGTAAFGVGYVLTRGFTLFELSTIRLACLALGFAYIKSLIPSTPTEDPTLNAFLEIRRNLSTNFVTPEEAFGQFEIARFGLKADAALQDETSEISRIISNAVANYSRMIATAEAAIEKLRDKGSPMTNGTLILINEAIENSTKLLDTTYAETFEKLNKLSLRLKAKAAQLKAVSPDSQAAVDNVLLKTGEEIGHMKSKQIELQTKNSEIKKLITSLRQSLT